MKCDDDQTNSKFKLIENNPSYSLCRVCGDGNAQMHYGALSCVSCKMFFRRNSQFDINDNQCVFDGQCNITISSRRTCRYCRLKKCFAIGMQRELLRAAHQQRRSRLKSMTVHYVIHPLDLLENDRSLLTTEQWSYLSNVTHLYDRKSPVFNVRNLLKDELSYPIKVRCKMAVKNMFIIMSTMYEGILPFIEQISHFNNLSVNDRSALMERNLKTAGGYSGIIICRDAEFCSSLTFKIGFSLVYGSVLMDDAIKTNNRADPDNTLIKLLLPTLIFSTGSDLYLSKISSSKNVYLESDGSIDQYRLLSNIKYVLTIQNFYVEILFKYMIFRYGYEEAASRFAGLIKNCLDQTMCALSAAEIQKHEQLIQTIVKQTETSIHLS